MFSAKARKTAPGRVRSPFYFGVRIELKPDSHTLVADVQFPRRLNLLWDAGRKCVDRVERFRASGYALPGG